MIGWCCVIHNIAFARYIHSHSWWLHPFLSGAETSIAVHVFHVYIILMSNFCQSSTLHQFGITICFPSSPVVCTCEVSGRHYCGWSVDCGWKRESTGSGSLSIYTHMHTIVHTCIHVAMYMYSHRPCQAHAHMYIHMHMCRHMYTRTRTDVHTHTHTLVLVYTSTCIYHCQKLAMWPP